MRCILIILDGLGDRGQDCFDGKTPLYAGYTPHLDHLASLGMNGLYHTLMQGIPMSSETAHFIIFGYDLSDFPGRGFIEAIGEGVEVKKNDVAILCHLSSVQRVDDNLILRYGCPDLSSEHAKILKGAIQSYESDGIRINLVHSKKIHGFLILNGKVSSSITDSDPIYEGRPVMEVMPIKQEGAGTVSVKTAEALNRYLIWCHQKLSAHHMNKERTTSKLLPINALVTQRAGGKRQLQPFRDKWGLRGLSISSGAIYWGLCEELGMDVVKVKDRKYRGRFEIPVTLCERCT